MLSVYLIIESGDITVKKLTLYVAVISLICLSGSLLFAQGTAPTQVVQSIGVGAIMYDDVAAARDRAIDDALRKAVEQTLGTYIDAQTKVENYMVVEDRILNWSRGYVKNYQIISEGKKTPETYEALIQATVDMTNLASDADAVQNLLQGMGNPRVMIMIDEANVGEVSTQYHYFEVNMTASETALNNKFLEKNFSVVDPATIRGNKQRDSIIAAINGDTKAAQSIAQALEAEVIITGKAVAKVATGINLGGMKSCQANINARVVDADVGTIIATSSKHAAYPHIDEVTGGTMAIEKAANALADELITKILEKWRSKFYSLNDVKLVITGLENYTEASNFKNALQFTARGVKSVFQRNVAAGTAEFDIKISGNAEQLARELDQRAVGEYNLAVTGATQNKVTLRAVRARTNANPDSVLPE